MDAVDAFVADAVVADAFVAGAFVAEAVVAEAIVTEAEGYKLHLSQSSSTGYTGVYVARRAKGRAFRACAYHGTSYINLGTHKTAVEAAVAYAKHELFYVPPERPAVSDEQIQQEEIQQEVSDAPTPATVGESEPEAAISAPEPEATGDVPGELACADNAAHQLTTLCGGPARCADTGLFLTDRNMTGYLGVSFQARYKERNLGRYLTAVDAATAYAHYVRADEKAAAAAAKHSERAVERAELAATGAALAMVGTIDLYRSSRSSTGYRGVQYHPSERTGRPFEASCTSYITTGSTRNQKKQSLG